MQQTEKYNFKLFEGSDPVLAESFNQNTELVESVLATKATVVTGNYTGQAEEGRNSAGRELTFDKKPLFLVVKDNYATAFFIRDAERYLYVTVSGLSGGGYCTWTDRSVSWHEGTYNASFGMDTGGNRYFYLALLAD